jgi:hypothetical protein
MFLLVYCSVIIFALLMPKKWHNKFFGRTEKVANFKEYNYKYGYYKGVIFWSGVAGGVITLIIKGVFY